MITHPVCDNPISHYAPLTYVQPVEDKPLNFNLSTSTSVGNAIIAPKFQRTKSASNIRESSREYADLLGEAPWVPLFLQTASTLNDVKSLLPFYMEINKLIAENKFTVCNSFLRQVRTQELSNTLLVGLLRLTSSYKNKLPYWAALRTNAKQELINRKQDADAILKGLL